MEQVENPYRFQIIDPVLPQYLSTYNQNNELIQHNIQNFSEEQQRMIKQIFVAQ